MKSLLICTSVSHGNTKKVADAIADVLDARVVEPGGVDGAVLAQYDLVGFGSGIYRRSFHPELRQFVESLSPAERGKAFVYATSGFSDSRTHRFVQPFVGLLEDKGFDVVGAFSSRALDTFLPFRLIGGHRKGRPNASDLDSARRFADELSNQYAD